MSASKQPTRRAVITKAAMGTAAAWTAPVVLSSPALAAGSEVPPPAPVPGVLDWSVQYPKPAYPDPGALSGGPFPSQQFHYPTLGGVLPPPAGPTKPIPDSSGTTTLTIVGGNPLGVQIRTTDPAPSIGVVINDLYRNFLVYWGDNAIAVPPGPYMPPRIGGVIKAYFLMQINPTVPATQFIQTEIEFDRPVTSLQFNIDGIDVQNTSADIVTVDGFLGGTGGTVVAPGLTKQVPASTVFSIAGNVMTGLSGAISNGSNLGNAVVSFPGPVDTVRIHYRGTNASSVPPFGQYIGIRDMSFLVSPT